MATTTRLPALELTKQQTRWLQEIVLSKDEPRSAVVRARILLRYDRGETVRTIAQREHISRPTVQLCIEKALSAGISTAVRDLARPGRPGAVTDEDKEWVIHLACSRPSDLGYHSQTWSLTQLTTHVMKHARSSGHLSLERASKYIIRSILHEASPTVHYVSFSRRTPEYSKTSVSLLTLSKEISLVLHTDLKNDARPKQSSRLHSQRTDRSPALDSARHITIEPEAHPLRLQAGSRESVISIRLLAGVDLSDGRMITLVQSQRKGNSFIEFLEQVDSLYPSNLRIRIIPGSFSSAASRQNIRALKQHPNRFDFEEPCTDWPLVNFVDAFFTRMVTALLRSMHVDSETQFIQRLNRYLEEVSLFSGERLTSRHINEQLSIA